MQKFGTPPHGRFLVYHGTNTLFEQFSLDYGARPGMSGNGHLGVWLAVDRDLAERFGSHCLQVAIEVGCAYRMPLRELADMNRACYAYGEHEPSSSEFRENERKFYTAYREKLINAGYDAIYLVESDDRVEMVIGLVPERLLIQTRFPHAA